MLPSDSMHHMRQRTWQEILQAGLQSILVAGALGTGALHPGPVTSNPTSKIPDVTQKRGKFGETVEKKKKSSGDGSKFSIHTGVENLRSWLDFGRDSLNDLADSVARGTHANSGYGLPGFSAGVEGALR